MAIDQFRNTPYNPAAPVRGTAGDTQPALRPAKDGASNGDSFAATLLASVAELRSQTIGSLLDATNGRDDPLSVDAARFGALLPGITGQGAAPSGPLAGVRPTLGGAVGAVNGLSPTGRNLALFDPESAYRMMTLINQKEVLYKAEFSEMSDMREQLATMQQAGQSLAGIGESTGDAALRERLTEFAAQYNQWVARFDAAMQPDGLLAGTQAAQVARYELKQSIENPFFGAADGFRGMAGLGLRIDPATRLAVLDTRQLDAALTSQRNGAIRTVQEFGRNFARSSELLISENNFVLRRLDNLDRVIDYIDAHKPSLQAEFGLGDPAQPPQVVAQALAAYQQLARR